MRGNGYTGEAYSHRRAAASRVERRIGHRRSLRAPPKDNNKVGSGSNNGGGWIFLGLIALAVSYFLIRDSDWLAKRHATSQYGVPDSKIETWGTRPHDCDFLTAPIGLKHCRYEREYLAEWFTLSKSGYPISYGDRQAQPPTACSAEELDFTHRCYVTELQRDEHPTANWRARFVVIRWRKVEE
jgi:hypothetical protein